MLSLVCEEKTGTCFNDHIANISGRIRRGHMDHGAIIGPYAFIVNKGDMKQEDVSHVAQNHRKSCHHISSV